MSLVFCFCEINSLMLYPKKAGGQFDPCCGYSKIVFSGERVEPRFFVTFNIIISHIFHECFSGRLEEMKISPSILTIFTDFSDFFDISLLQRCQNVTDDVCIFL